MFCYNNTYIAPEEELLNSDPLFKGEAKDSIWTISDIVIAPRTENFIIYSTMSGILHFMRKYYKLLNNIGLD